MPAAGLGEQGVLGLPAAQVFLLRLHIRLLRAAAEEEEVAVRSMPDWWAGTGERAASER